MRVIGTKSDSHLMVYQCHALVAKLIILAIYKDYYKG